MKYVSDHVSLPSHKEAVRRYFAIVENLTPTEVSHTLGPNTNQPAPRGHDHPRSHDMYKGGDPGFTFYLPEKMPQGPSEEEGFTFDLPEEMPQGPSEEETPIRDGEALGFGSDSSEIEEAPSDYPEEF
ncbi:hypothetical protein PGT21_017982 [Puccinia graminis f. sp. tritici]|uniref:Uncharacterized protein n=1 Tax=Puccinia graminis f. sp. tritici TaxID=56615 RepID=A0A5B0Q5X1_PUCGR|nr:hypothetical protein PGT21_017982 [Puccinia graminis f. sp. tritici]